MKTILVVSYSNYIKFKCLKIPFEYSVKEQTLQIL